MKKIMFYINAIHHGGAERVLCNLATKFSECGYQCILVTSFRAEWEYSYGNKVKRISLFEHNIKGFVSRNLSLVRALREVIKKESPDIVISFMAEPNYRSIISCLGLKTKTLISVRNDPDREYPNKIFKILAKTLYLFADGIVFQTADAQAWFSKRIRNKSRIIHNQIEDSFFNVKPSGMRRDIVSVGRLVEQKNHALLIKAFAQICEEIDDNLIIYGEGEKGTELESLAANLGISHRVKLPGAVVDVPNAIKNAKIFVLSSDFEGMPNALLEAMALGLPCISTDCPCGGPKYLFDNEKNGILTKVGDAGDLVNKLLYLINDEACRNVLGKNALIAASRFSPSAVFDEWKKYVDDIVS